MKPLSLKARAIALLAQREHSRSELQRKLLRIARQQDEKERQARREAGADAHEAESDAESDAESGAADVAGEVDTLLEWLQANRYLSEARFVESRINARAQRYGNLRIRQELSQHGLAADAASQQALKDSEFERARQVWQRKFGEIAADPAARAKQMRFLAGRGFSPEVIRKVVQGTEAD